MLRCVVLAFTLALPLTATAQHVPIKTVPVAEGAQFVLFPSQNRSMGGVSIALTDPLHDPFVNPARGAEVAGMRVSSTPLVYRIATDASWGDQAGGRTLPVTVLGRRGAAFGGLALAWQELTAPPPAPTFRTWDGLAPAGDLSFVQDNRYAFGMGGMRIPGTDLAVGASVFWAGLQGLEGVRLLYDSRGGVDQDGHLLHLRLGLVHDRIAGGQAELVVLHHRFSMRHYLLAAVPVWNFMPTTWDEPALRVEPRTEHDETRGWAVQGSYRRAAGAGWQLGVRLTGDWSWHPKIPNYDLMQIPRDPGNSSAYRFGVGAAREDGRSTVALDLVYEPIWSHTWAVAAERFTGPNGSPRPAGSKTIDNRFRFHDGFLRAGLRHQGDHVDFSLGLRTHLITYHLDQQDFVRGTERTQDERWTEWTFTGGLGYRFDAFAVRYQASATLGTGRPGIAGAWGGLRSADGVAFAGANWLAAPRGALVLQEAVVFAHQVTVTVPLAEP